MTGTMGGLAPVLSVDGRTIGDGTPGPVTKRLTALYADLTATTGTPSPDASGPDRSVPGSRDGVGDVDEAGIVRGDQGGHPSDCTTVRSSHA